LTPEAVADVDRALAYYAAIRVELLFELQDELDEYVAIVGDRPLSFQKHTTEVRRAFLEKFPYGVFFIVEPTEVAPPSSSSLRANQ